MAQVDLSNQPYNSGWLLSKRLFDLLVGSMCLLITAPFIVIILVWIMIDSPGNPIFIQKRVGRSGKTFSIYKMRTLYVHCFGIAPGEEQPNHLRITRAGRILRRSKLDELPQLLNVLRGDMSLVGPRPDIPEQVVNYSSSQKNRLIAKPGMTGIAQISGNTLLSWPERIELDIWYIKNWSLGIDIKILILTLSAIFQGESIKSDPFHLRTK
jgi:lipopolysaccharide/colanic/teichoic acid biosynthesis glycosyltransferase